MRIKPGDLITVVGFRVLWSEPVPDATEQWHERGEAWPEDTCLVIARSGNSFLLLVSPQKGVERKRNANNKNHESRGGLGWVTTSQLRVIR